MRVRLRTMVAVSVAAMMGASVAHAEREEITFAGTVIPNYYGSGLNHGSFGPQQNLGGDEWTATVVIDTTLGIDSVNRGVQTINGGRIFAATDPVLSASLTINSVTQTIQTGNYSNVELAPGAWTYINVDDEESDNLELSILSPDVGTSLDDLHSTKASGHGASDGSFTFPLGSTHGWADGFFDTDSVVVTKLSDVSAAPEPSTWALMLVGLGGIGLAMRRRRSSAALA